MEALDIAKLLATNLRRLMEAQTPPWSQERLGRELEFGSGNASRLMSGKHPPTAATLAKCATLFDIELCDLLCEARKPAKKK